MKSLLKWVALWLCLAGGFRLQAQEDAYVQIYDMVQEGNTLRSAGQLAPALAKYMEAQAALRKFQMQYPGWNSGVVNFRLNYLAGKIDELSAKTPHDTPVAAKGAPGGQAPSSAAKDREWQEQLESLQGQVRQLQADKILTEAKLKEALSARPASVDPEELAKAEEQIRSLEKENGLLKVSLSQRGTNLPAGNAEEVERVRAQLAEAGRQLAVQTESAKALALDKAALQRKLDSLILASWNATNREATRKELEESNRKLAEQTEAAKKIAQERDALQEKLKSLAAESEATAALRAENEVLKKQLATYQKGASASKSSSPDQQLQEARTQIAALKSDLEILRLEKTALQDRVKSMTAEAVGTNAAAAPAAVPAEATQRVRQLEQERDDLRKQLAAAQKELRNRKGRNAAARVDELSGQLEILRTRLGVYEAQQVPYSEEELALLRSRKPVLTTASTDKKSIRELPAGTAQLVAEAQRDFSNKRFDKAEEKYLAVLSKDEQNPDTLANLAAIQVERDHFDEAEKNIKRALSAAPDDAYSLWILGNLKFRQGKYDEALEALSKAAKLDPRNPHVQNFLGMTLSEKGMRGPAETALRKAVQLDPGYGEAHNNLAVIYLAQQPPSVELARWHYQKALAAGMPRNLELEKKLAAAEAAATP